MDESYVFDGAQRLENQRVDQLDQIATGSTSAEQRPYPSALAPADHDRGVPAVPTRSTIKRAHDGFEDGERKETKRFSKETGETSLRRRSLRPQIRS